jgi:hypothetical protein
MTPSFFTSAAAPTEGVLLKVRHCCVAAQRTACLDAAENISSMVQKTVLDTTSLSIVEVQNM